MSNNDKQKESRFSDLEKELNELAKKLGPVKYDGSPRPSRAHKDGSFISTQGRFGVPWPSEKSVYPLRRDDGKSIY